MNRKLFIGAAGTVAAFPHAARAAESYVLRLGVPNAPGSSPVGAGLRFAQAVHQRSNGQITIEVYPSGQLAKEQETVDGLTSGVVDFAIVSSGFLQALFPHYQVFDMPFLFRDVAASRRVLDGPIGDELFAELEPRGILGLGWGMNGYKELATSSKSIASLDDMRGLRVRVQNGAVYVATYQALGAIPVPLDTAETYAAIQQRTVDGLDNSINSIATAKFYTVCKHVAMLNSIFTVVPLLGSKRKIEALPAPLQALVRREAKNVIPFWREAVARQLTDDIATLRANGVGFTNVPYAPFRKAVDPVYAQFQAKLGGDLLQRVTRAAGA